MYIYCLLFSVWLIADGGFDLSCKGFGICSRLFYSVFLFMLLVMHIYIYNIFINYILLYLLIYISYLNISILLFCVLWLIADAGFDLSSLGSVFVLFYGFILSVISCVYFIVFYWLYIITWFLSYFNSLIFPSIWESMCSYSVSNLLCLVVLIFLFDFSYPPYRSQLFTGILSFISLNGQFTLYLVREMTWNSHWYLPSVIAHTLVVCDSQVVVLWICLFLDILFLYLIFFLSCISFHFRLYLASVFFFLVLVVWFHYYYLLSFIFFFLPRYWYVLSMFLLLSMYFMCLLELDYHNFCDFVLFLYSLGFLFYRSLPSGRPFLISLVWY